MYTKYPSKEDTLYMLRLKIAEVPLQIRPKGREGQNKRQESAVCIRASNHYRKSVHILIQEPQQEQYKSA
jgi:hypothetical protein